MNTNAKYFLIIVLLVFFMLLNVYVSQNSKESFYEETTNELLSPEKVLFIQGLGVPDESISPMRLDTTDPSMQSVDGSPNGPKSMFMFAYNKCDMNCCDTSPYSCNGGCVCITPNQYNMVTKNNNCFKQS